MSIKLEINSIATNETSKCMKQLMILSNAVASQSGKLQDKFLIDHGFIKWSFENFSSFPREEDKFAVSPTFTLKDTWWYLTLHPTLKILGINHITISLFRSKVDHGPRTVTVSYRLGLESGGNKVWFDDDEGFIFGKGYGYGVQTSVFGNLEDFLIEGDQINDTISVLCEMYVSYTLHSESETCKQSLNLKLLSTDLFTILNAKKCTDVLIEIPNFRIKVHKSILCARSRTLAKMLENGESYIQFSCMSKSCLFCLLFYMYSGKFDFLASKAVFSIGIYEYARKLSLTGLVNLLAPTRIELKTRVSVEELKATWSICDFSLKEIFSKKFFYSPEFKSSDSTDFTIKFCITPLHTDCINIESEISGITRALDTSVEISVLDSCFQPKKTAEVKFLKASNITLASSAFSVKDILSCVFDGTLFISCTCKIYSLTSILDTSSSFHSSPKGEDSWLNDLSDNLKNLYEAGTLSDVTLKADKKVFKLHRSILSARSRTFQKIFLYNQYKGKTLEISDVQPRILELMLEYMYCGRISLTTNDSLIDLLHLYEAAGKYRIRHLKTTCAVVVYSKISSKNVFNILEWAKRHGDSFLISKCMTYINKDCKLSEKLEQCLKTERENTTTKWKESITDTAIDRENIATDRKNSVTDAATERKNLVTDAASERKNTAIQLLKEDKPAAKLFNGSEVLSKQKVS